MKVLLIAQAPTREGERPRLQRPTVEAFALRVGREAGSEIHLPDARVGLQEGVIFLRDGLVFTRSISPRADASSRHSVMSERITRERAIRIGPYRLEWLPAPDGYDAALRLVKFDDVPVVRPDESALTNQARRLTLASFMGSRRWLAWTALVLTFVLTFVLPVITPLAGKPPDARAAPNTLARLHAIAWNTGPLTRAHETLAHRCATCHGQVLSPVQDQACLACHQSIHGHVGAPGVQLLTVQNQRCADCHREHKGTRALQRDDDRTCVDCHRDLTSLAPRTALRDATDFARSHPEFRAVSQASAALPQTPHKEFSHAVHMATGGVKSRVGERVVLGCNDCHRPDPRGRGFATVHFASDCSNCHSAQSMFLPAAKPTPAMPSARFDHGRHRQTPCGDCHAVMPKGQAAEQLLPGIETCRSCHGGSQPARDKVTSNCLLCHGFHTEPGIVKTRNPR
jgi:predicted CXXCH cytochrome family protein